MKKILFITLIVSFMAIPVAHAWELVSDPQPGAVRFDLQIDGMVFENIPMQPDGSIIYNIDNLSVGSHTFKGTVYDQSGWGADSDPFVATKPRKPVLRIVK